MQDYMREYRQGQLRGDSTGRHPDPTRCEKLKTAQRLYSFKWRLSTLLGPQYDLLFCVEYVLEKWSEEYGIPRWTSDEVPQTEWFWCHAYPGGGEIFKLFVLMRFSRNYDWLTTRIVGVLDKAALLKNLQCLTRRKQREWNDLIEKLEVEVRNNKWYELDFSNGGYL
jgi:hypothetical protein